MPPKDSQGEHDVQRLQQRLSETIGERRYRHWFEGKTRFVLCGDILRVEAASHYLLNWIQRQYGETLLAALHAAVHPGLRVQYEVDAALTLQPPSSAVLSDAGNLPAASTVGRATPRPAVDTPSDVQRSSASPAATRRQYDLRDFVVGACNQLAHTAARQVAAAPGVSYSPLYLYSSVGNGKTHLLEGIAREIKRAFPALQVMFLTAENFTNFFTRALSERSLPAFRQKFRGCDVLLVDDVDFLEGKKAIQEEFLHTIQQLEAAGRQIVLTGDRHPRLLTRLCDELVTRFLSGLVCRIETPSGEMRRSVVARVATERKLQVSDRAIDFVSTRFTGSVRELVGAMNTLAVWQSLHQKRVGVTAAREVLASLERDCLKIVRLDDIDRAVCKLFGVTSRDLKGDSRVRTVSQPRMLAMFLARRMTTTAYSEIGRHYGDRNHSTVLSAERKIARQVEENATMRIATEDWPVRDVVQTLEQQILAG
ncbi:MAG: chromosomal replication initiator protein DnaA [Planctomycetaceae bacterium]|nr:chromosomal replication initiator protein DnaA [Planctomycetaceae bacterium]